MDQQKLDAKYRTNGGDPAYPGLILGQFSQPSRRWMLAGLFWLAFVVSIFLLMLELVTLWNGIKGVLVFFVMAALTSAYKEDV